MSIGKRLLLLALVPTLALLGIGGMQVIEKLQLRASAQGTVDLVALTRSASALVHELQKERGLSVGAISSGSDSMLQKLAAQQKQTDAASDAFSALLAESGVVDDYSILEPELRVIDEALGALAQLRQQIT